MTEGKALLLQAKVTDKDLDTFESKLLNLCQQYFLDPLKSDLLIPSRLKDIIKKYEEKKRLSKFEEVYIHEYMLRSLSGFLPDFQKKIRHKVAKNTHPCYNSQGRFLWLAARPGHRRQHHRPAHRPLAAVVRPHS